MEQRKYDVDGLITRLDALAKKHEVSGVIGVYKGGETLFSSSYGYENREAEIAARLDMRFCFDLRARFLLALCVLSLAEKKKLRLSDKLHKFLPEYKYAKDISVKQLFLGTSGVPDYIACKWRMRMDADEAHRALPAEERFRLERALSCEFVSFARLMEEIGEEELAFEPGTDSRFSASECGLLWELIERVSGMRVFDCLKTFVFGPLAMDSTVEGCSGKTVYYGRVQSRELVRMPATASAYAYTTTLADMEKLLRAFVNGGILSEPMWETALKMNMEGRGIGFAVADGTIVAADEGFEAGNLRLYFSKETGVSYLTLFNEDQQFFFTNGELDAFCPNFRREVEAAFTFPKNPRVVSCGRRYGYDAMDIEIAPEQVTFVPDAKTCLAFCCVERPLLKPFVLVDGSRVIGFIALRVDKKKQDYHIDLLIVDRRFQGRGYGKILLQFGIDYLKARGAKELTIGVKRENHVARRLYENVGFTADKVYEGGVHLKMVL